MALILLPLATDALRDPAEWNSDWELLLRRGGELAFPRGVAMSYYQRLKVLGTTASSVDDVLGDHQDLISSTCAVQRNLTEEALDHFTHHDFEARWMKAGADVRGQHILGAMASVCSKAQNLNEARSYCPELRLMHLQLDGNVFLDLVKAVMLGDASFIPSQPVYVSHSGWDAWAAEQSSYSDSDAKKIALAQLQILRTKLVCHVVQFTLRSFFGKDYPKLTVQKQHAASKTKNPVTAQARSQLVAALGAEAAKARLREEKAGLKALRSERRGQCTYMGCHNSEPEDGSKKFSRCKVCFETRQRQVLYCSAECQRADWKLRHRSVCGKPFDFETATEVVEHPTAAKAAHARIGPPADGYKRSVALTAQVTALNRNPSVAYQLYKPDGDPIHIDFGAGEYPQHAFCDRREWAMTTGHRGCIARMAHYLCAAYLSNITRDNQGITSNLIVAQLAREFEYEGLREAVLIMQELQNEDPLHRPPLLDETTPEQWLSLSGQNDMASIVVTLD
ncbi:hypothetical protein C8R47DRAFT_1194009 [Mycena vitilis]|nr:hypothetical protein C8R47DRAFT_1194009 [Mycena vitilis]